MADACPKCEASLLPDQRYCLQCGQRRGDPRLPFMDAVTFMGAAKGPQVTEAAPDGAAALPDRRPFMSANASLVAGVATLVLAIGVGVLIGRSGNGSTNTAAPAPQIIRVGGGEGGATASTPKGSEAAASTTIGGNTGKQPKSATVQKAKQKAQTGKSGASKATEEVFEPAAGVKIAPPEQKLGGKCDPSTAGCGKNGQFEGSFFE